MLKMRHFLSGAILFAVIAVHADSKPTISIDRKTSDSLLRATFHAYSQDSMVRAYRVRALKIADGIIARNSDYYKNDLNARNQVYREELRRANAEAAVDVWRGGFVETSLRTASMGVFGTASALSIPTGIGPAVIGAGGFAADAFITSQFEGLDKDLQGKAQSGLSTDERIRYNVIGDSIRMDPKYAFVAQELDLGVYQSSADMDPNVRLSNQQEAGQENIRQMNARLQKKFQQALTDGKVTHEEFTQLVKETRGEIAQMGESIREDLRMMRDGTPRQQEMMRHQAKRADVTGAFAAMSTLAQMFGESKLAYNFGKMGDFSGAVLDLTSGLSSFKVDPIRCTNLYLFAASTLLDLANGTQNKDDQLMKALQSIAQQIDDLRNEMRQSFVQMQARMDYFHYDMLVNLSRIESGQKSLLQAVYEVQSQMRQSRDEVKEKDLAAARLQLREYNAKCFAEDGRKRPLKLNSKREAGHCFSKAIAIAEGDLKFLDNSARETAEREFDLLTGFDARNFKRLAKSVESYQRVPAPAAYAPGYFESGVRDLLDLIRWNPSHANIALTQNWLNRGDSSSSFDDLIRRGQTLDQFHANMLLTEVETEAKNEYRLNSALPKDLLVAYRNQLEIIKGVIEEQSENANGTTTPDTYRKWSKGGPAPVTYVNMRLPKSKVSMCPGATVQVKQWVEENFLFEHNRQGRVDRLHAFAPETMGLNEKFLQFIPAYVQWADLAGTQAFGSSFQISMCFSQAEFQLISLSSSNFGGADRVTIQLALTAEVWITYQDSKGEKRAYKVWRIAGQRRADSGFFDPQFTRDGLLSMIWNGTREGSGESEIHYLGPKPGMERRCCERPWERRPTTATEFPKRSALQLFPNPNNTFGIVNSPDNFFKDAPDIQVQNDRAAFEKEFISFLDTRKPTIFQMSKKGIGPQREEIQSIQWQLDYLLRNGLDMNHKMAREFYQMVFSGRLPSADTFLEGAVAQGPTEALADADKQILEVKKELEKLEKMTDLRPAASVTRPYVDLLITYKRGYGSQPSSREGWGNWFRRAWGG